jgi:hypothetical protein
MNSEKYQRRLVWYQRFSNLLQFLRGKPEIPEVMFEVFDLLDTKKAFGSERVAYSAHLSLVQALRDHGYRVR